MLILAAGGSSPYLSSVPPPLVNLSSLEDDLDQSEACLVHSVRWSGGQDGYGGSCRFILVHQSSS